jgi:hypothetical protein
MTSGPGLQAAAGRGLAGLFRHIEAWTRPVPEPVLGLALLALAAVFITATLRERDHGHADAGKPETADNPPASSSGPDPAADRDTGDDSYTHQCHPPARSTP